MPLHERFRKYMETMVNMLTVNGNQYKLFGFVWKRVCSDKGTTGACW